MIEPGETSTASAAVAIDPRRQATARAYARERYEVMLIDLVVSFILVVGFLLSGASLWLKNALVFLPNTWLLLVAYTAIVFIAYTLLNAPLSWYSGFVLPHRYDMSTQTHRGWLADDLKSLALGLLFGIPIILAVYWLLDAHGATWWVWASLLAVILGIVMSFLAPVLLLPIFYKLTPLDDPILTARVERLAQQTSIHIAGVYTINLSSRSKAANAVFMGLGRSKRIALGDTLYAAFTPDEIETIIAHELGHQAQHDEALGIATQAVLTTCGLFLADLFLRWGVRQFGFTGVSDIAAMPLLALAAGVFSLAAMPLANAFSRSREQMADAFAMRATGKPGVFASAMTRLANQNLAQVDPPRWLVLLLYSHPPISERIAMAERYGR